MQTPACLGEVSHFLCRSFMKRQRKILTTILSVVRDVRERGRDVEGCIKQWFAFVKPNFEKVRLPNGATFQRGSSHIN